jgi:hypothetical protein
MFHFHTYSVFGVITKLCVYLLDGGVSILNGLYSLVGVLPNIRLGVIGDGVQGLGDSVN